MAGTAATSSGIRSGDKLGPTLETKGRKLFAYLPTLAAGALDPGVCMENNLFEIVLAALTMILKNGHPLAPLLFNITKESMKSKAESLFCFPPPVFQEVFSHSVGPARVKPQRR